MTPRVLTKSYAFHGFKIDVSGDAEILAALDARLVHFSACTEAAVDLTFEFVSVANRAAHAIEKPPGRARPVEDLPDGEVVYIATVDQLYMSYEDDVRVLCDFGRREVRYSIFDSERDYSWLVTHFLFTCPLTELLKRHGLYCLHAAGLSINGRAILIPGTSGAGKSTLAVALARAGFEFLGDDMLFLVSRPAGLRVLAWPDEVDVADETIRLFPELQGLKDLPVPAGYYKRQFRPEQAFGARLAFESAPTALVFPRVAHAEKSVLTSIGRDEALLELVPNALLTEARSTQAHLDAFGELVRACSCYRLETGRDVEALPTLLRDLLE